MIKVTRRPQALRVRGRVDDSIYFLFDEEVGGETNVAYQSRIDDERDWSTGCIHCAALMHEAADAARQDLPHRIASEDLLARFERSDAELIEVGEASYEVPE